MLARLAVRAPGTIQHRLSCCRRDTRKTGGLRCPSPLGDDTAAYQTSEQGGYR